MNPNNDTATLVDPKTMTTKYIDIDTTVRDEWLSSDGLDSIISKLAQDANRREPVKIDGNYLLLVYDDGKKIIPITNTDNMDENLNKKYLRPITYIELFYISIYDIRDKYPGFVTRYPVANLGGIYPTKIYVKTTVPSRDVEITFDNKTYIMHEYPILKEEFFNSMSVHNSKIGNLDAD